MSPAQKRELIETIDHAIEAIVSSWSIDRGTNLMDALSDLHVIKYAIQAETAGRRDRPQGTDEPSEVHATTPNTPDDPVALARSMQRRRHGGSS